MAQLGYGEGSIKELTKDGEPSGVYRGGSCETVFATTRHGAARNKSVRNCESWPAASMRARHQRTSRSAPTSRNGSPRWVPRKSPRTREHDRWALEQLGAPICAKRLRDLKVKDIEAELDRLSKRKAQKMPTNPSTKRPIRGRGKGPLGRSSLVKVRRALAEVLTEAQRHDLVTKNVADPKLARLPVDAAPKGERRSLTPDEALALLDAAEGERLEALIVTMLYCGLRPGEATGLPWDAIDFKAKTLTVRQALVRKPGGGVALGEPKVKSYRVIRLPGMVLDALKTHRKAQRVRASRRRSMGGPRPRVRQRDRPPHRLIEPATLRGRPV